MTWCVTQVTLTSPQAAAAHLLAMARPLEGKLGIVTGASRGWSLDFPHLTSQLTNTHRHRRRHRREPGLQGLQPHRQLHLSLVHRAGHLRRGPALLHPQHPRRPRPSRRQQPNRRRQPHLGRPIPLPPGFRRPLPDRHHRQQRGHRAQRAPRRRHRRRLRGHLPRQRSRPAAGRPGRRAAPAFGPERAHRQHLVRVVVDGVRHAVGVWRDQGCC